MSEDYSLKLTHYHKNRDTRIRGKGDFSPIWEIRDLPGVVVISATKQKWFIVAAPDIWHIEDAASLEQKEWEELLAAHGFQSLEEYSESWEIIDALRNQCFATRRDALQALAALLITRSAG